MIPNTKAIEEAVKALTPVNGITKDGTGFLTREALDTALKVMQQYLAVKGFPEDIPSDFVGKICLTCKSFKVLEKDFDTWNSALHLCRLAVIKGVPSVEQMSRIIFEHYQNPNASAYLLATAIHKLYLTKLGIKEEK